jgi:hypothetical protein
VRESIVCLLNYGLCVRGGVLDSARRVLTRPTTVPYAPLNPNVARREALAPPQGMPRFGHLCIRYVKIISVPLSSTYHHTSEFCSFGACLAPIYTLMLPTQGGIPSLPAYVSPAP